MGTLWDKSEMMNAEGWADLSSPGQTSTPIFPADDILFEARFKCIFCKK